MTIASDDYEPRSYWERRLAEEPALVGEGYAALGLPFNAALYRQRERVLRRAIRRFRVPVAGARLLELGVGGGFYVPIWKSLGVADLVGIDITDVAVDRLGARYPEYRFVQADIGRALPVEEASFDIVTAFDVLLHIVDDEQFQSALRHAAAACRVGGHLLVSDQFLTHAEPVATSPHNVVRTLDRYRSALEAAGWQIAGRFPIFVTMHPPYDVAGGTRRGVALRWWRLLASRLRRHPEDGRWLGTLLGAADAALTAVVRDGPSTELLVARRVA